MEKTTESVKDVSPRSDEWLISQYNRNREPKDQVRTMQEMIKKVYGKEN